MARIPSSRIILLFSSILIFPTTAQTRDRQRNDLNLEVAELKRKAAAQEERIAQLEKALKALQESAESAGNIIEAILRVEKAVKDLKAIPVPAPIPLLTPPWHSASSWSLVKQGMSRVQVVEVLGPPTRETSVMDTQTLYYSDSVTAGLTGSVTLVGDRLTTMAPPTF